MRMLQWHNIQNSSKCIDAVPAQFLNTYILVTREFIISRQNGSHGNQAHMTCQFQYCQSAYQIFRGIQTKIDEIILKDCIFH